MSEKSASSCYTERGKERAEVQVFPNPHNQDPRNTLFRFRILFQGFPGIGSRNASLGSRKDGEFNNPFSIPPTAFNIKSTYQNSHPRFGRPMDNQEQG